MSATDETQKPAEEATTPSGESAPDESAPDESAPDAPDESAPPALVNEDVEESTE